jgi:predicted ATPase/DNA-binding CsgD family transcriptional regulator
MADDRMQENEYSLKLRLQNILVGRDNEIEAVKMQFDRVLEGNSAVTVLAGEAGIGKTALLKRVLRDLLKLNGVCVYGKFEQYKDKGPYIPVIQIIEQITNHMLTLPGEKLDRLVKKLNKELGKDSALITGIVPQTQRIMRGSGGIKDSDYQKLQRRLEKAFQIFITIAARELYPLVIAVDDIQWADAPSWNIIRAASAPLNEHDLYLILACRNNLEKYRDKVKLMLAELYGKKHLLEINLQPLSYEEVKIILRKVFSGSFQDLYKLARLVYRKTTGNPLYIKQLINLLLDNKAVYHDSNKNSWCLDSGKAREVMLPDANADIISSKIECLSSKERQLLEIASCIGSRFSRQLLDRIIKNKIEKWEDSLENLCRAGLIVEAFDHSGRGDAGEFEFFHDRIYQYVYDHIEAERKERLHFAIAMELLNHPDKVYVEENLLSITAHLLECKNVIKKRGPGERLVVDLYFAGIKARRSAAFEHARKLFKLGEELLGKACWTKNYEHALKIKLELAECEFICGNYEAAKNCFKELQKHALSKEDRTEIIKRYLTLCSSAGSHGKVIELGFQALKLLGFNINGQMLPYQIAREVLHGKILFRSSRLEFIKNAPLITDKRIATALEILTIMAAAANMTDEKLFALIVLKIGNLSAKYGNSPYSPLGYAAYSLVLGTVMGDFKNAQKLKDISLNLAELFADDQFGTATYFCLGTFVVHWLSPVEESLSCLYRAFDCGIRSGDYLYCSYTLIMLAEMKYLSGESLNELEKFLKLHEKYVQRINNDILKRSFAMFKDHINILSQPGFSPGDRLVKDKEIESLGTNEAMIYCLLKMQRLYLAGKTEEAYKLAQKSIGHLGSVMGSITQVDFVFFYLLVCLEYLKDRGKEVSRQTMKACRKYRKALEKWAQTNPENHLGKHLLIQALLASLHERQQDAARLYNEAIEHAKRRNNLLLEALANYLAAGYFSGNPKIAGVFALDAFRLFAKWGAVRIVKRVCRQFKIDSDYAAGKANSVEEEAKAPENNRQAEKIFEARVKDHQKKLETLTLEDAHKYFLDTICRETGADYCAILLEEDDMLKTVYESRAGRAAIKYPAGLDPEQSEHLPKKVIRYAGRTFEEVVINAKPEDGPFAGDDYIKKRPAISIICLPLKYNDIFTGLVYLESRKNNCFSSSTVEYIKRQSFYLVARRALESEKGGSGKSFINQQVKEQLTEREMEVLYYMALGMTNKEIGKKLYISASTVKTHTVNLYGKLEVNSRVQAVAKAKTLGLI